MSVSFESRFVYYFVYYNQPDERLQSKTKEFTCLVYTGLVVELEHLKIETRLINEKFRIGELFL